MDVTLPEKTAGPCLLPDGTEVWVQTLNSLQMGKARAEADLLAMRETQLFRKGGEGWEMEAALAEEREPSDLVEALVSEERESLRQKAEELHPVPQMPVRGENERDEQFAERVVRHDEASASVAGKREKAAEAGLAEARKRGLALPAADQVECWCRLQLEGRRRAAFTQRMVISMLFYGTRHAHDHSRLFFTSVAAVEDLDDSTRETLTESYFGWDTMTVEAVPTSPPVSSR